MTSLLLDLPTEMLNDILWYLDLVDLHSCRLVHPVLYLVINDSVILKYLTALKASGMEDNRLHAPNHTAERLSALRRRESGWASLRFDYHHTMLPKPKLALPIILDGGVLFVLDDRQMNIHYVTLPLGTDNPEPEWQCFRSETKVLYFGLAVDEHDLVAVATTYVTHDTTKTSTNANIKILLLQVSTTLPHPLAQVPTIVMEDTPYHSCMVFIGISGSNMVVLVNNFRNNSADRGFVYEWMSGVLKMAIAAPHNSYSSILFLSVDKVLLPNRINKTLDIWKISCSARMTPRTQPDTVLEFLPFREGTILVGLSCWSAPNVAAHGSPHSKMPFRPSPADSIVYFRVRIQSFHTTPLEDAIPPLDFRAPARVTGSVRVFTADVIVPQWLTATAGERYVARSGKSEIIVLDFNAKRAGALKERGDGGVSSRDDEDMCAWQERAPSRFMHSSLREPLVSELPYAYYKRKNMGPFHSVLMDEWSVLGIRATQGFDWTITEIEVMRLGPD